MATCKVCNIDKDESEFYKSKNKKGVVSLDVRCKSCVGAKNKKWREANKEKALAYGKKRREENPDEMKRWREAKQDHIKQYREANKERDSQYHKKAYQDNKKKFRDARTKWKADNKDKVRRQRNAYKAKPEVKEKARIDAQRRFWMRTENRLHNSMCCSMRRGIAEKKSGRSWESLIGYTLNDLMTHLESQFQPGMSWDNYGRHGWHIDHIKPFVLFSFSDPSCDEFQQCWALSNLQPLWAKDNLSKGCKYVA